MKLAKFKLKKQNNTKNIMIAFGVIISFLVAGYISKSYAIYKLEKKYDIIQSKVGTFPKGDLQVSVLVDGQETNTFPTYQDNYYVESIDCTNGVNATFDVENWQINIADMSATSTKCTISFDSTKTNSVTPINMSKSQLVALNESITNTTGKALASYLYPVGSIYISTEDDTVAKVEAKFGGTWESFGQGKTLVGVDANDTSFDTIEETGGEKTHTLSVDEMPQHTHTFTGTRTLTENTNLNHRHYNDKSSVSALSAGAHTHPTTPTGAAFLTSYVGDNLSVGSGGSKAGTVGGIGSAGAHTHQVQGWTSYVNNSASNAAWNHQHYYTAAGSNANAGSSQAHNNLQPYITTYMYKRVS